MSAGGRAAHMIERLSPNCEPRPAGVAVDMLIVHYTGMISAEAALERLADPAAKVSAHYLIDEAGRIYSLVPETLRAWHAGIACWRGKRDINGRSIGIELVNPGHEFGYRDFPAAQMAALAELARAIIRRHGIAAERVLGHSDVAPQRKMDPGERFDWRGLARSGIGIWPGELPAVAAAPRDPAAARLMLAHYGYEVPDPAADPGGFANVVAAFQRHFRPEKVDGALDAQTLGRLAALNEALGAPRDGNAVRT